MSRVERPSPGLRGAPTDRTFTFEGRAIAAAPSDTIASALLAAGEAACRTSATGPRGVFCGMGVCHECLVTVDGDAGVRACMTPARPDTTVTREPIYAEGRASATTDTGGGAASAAPRRAASRRAARTVTAELLVVGGGPAGLAAAAAAGEAGVATVLVDERAKLGGQYYKQPADALVASAQELDAQYRAGRALVERVRAAGVTVLGGVELWGADSPRRVFGVSATEDLELRADRLAIASGAYERGLPVPGWTLPGVLTTGAAQALLRAYQVAPGQRVLVAGNGPLNMQVAAELVRAGVTVVALAELAPLTSVSRLPALAAMTALNPDLGRDGLAYGWTLRRAGVPVRFRHALVRAEGNERVEAAVLARLADDGTPVPGSERRYAVDAVCVGYGFMPSNELARSLGCALRWSSERGYLEVETNAAGRTSVDDVWLVGDGGGIGGARAAQASGTLAGLDVARSLGRIVPTDAHVEPARARARNRRFQRALWRAYAAPRLVDELADDDTLICRCENVTLGEVRATLDQGIGRAGSIKRLTRAGMGRCQGRYCSTLMAELAARTGNDPLDEARMLAPAAPFKPLAIEILARGDDEPAS